MPRRLRSFRGKYRCVYNLRDSAPEEFGVRVRLPQLSCLQYFIELHLAWCPVVAEAFRRGASGYLLKTCASTEVRTAFTVC